MKYLAKSDNEYILFCYYIILISISEYYLQKNA